MLLAGLGSLLATAVTPYGVRVWSYAAGLATNPVIRKTITEWQPPSIEVYTGAAFFVSVVVAAALLIARVRRPVPWGSLLSLVVFLAIVRIWAIPAAADLVFQPAQVLIVFLLDPLLAAFSIWVGLAVSARSSDVRVAQQLSALATLPWFALLSLFTFRILSPTVGLALAAGVLLALVDVLAYRVVSTMFDRERLLTRYGRG